MQNQANSSKSELQDAEKNQIKQTLKLDEMIATILIQTVGRLDNEHQYLKNMKEANVPMNNET